LLNIGDTREEFCENCEAVTLQRLDNVQTLGSGEQENQVWWCLDGDHLYGSRPSTEPPLDEPS
jgi:hypothetical protein